VLLQRSSLWFEIGRPVEASADVDAAIAREPYCADIYCHRGQLAMLRHDLGVAVDDLRRAVELDGGSLLARLKLAMAYHRLGRPADARALLLETERLFPLSAEALNCHGELLVEEGDFRQARDKFNQAVEVSAGSFALAFVNLGGLRLHLERDVEGAIEMCTQAIAADPLCETAHVHMAHLMLQKKDLTVAVAAFDSAISLLRDELELEETFAMREAASVQLALITEQPGVFLPALARQ